MSHRKVSVLDGPVAYRCRVFLDGVRLETCVAADPIEGWADIYADIDGDLASGKYLDELTIKRLYGVVRLESIE